MTCEQLKALADSAVGRPITTEDGERVGTIAAVTVEDGRIVVQVDGCDQDALDDLGIAILPSTKYRPKPIVHAWRMPVFRLPVEGES